MSYCDIAPDHPLHGPYHDGEYGFPSWDETVLFERLVLEINQAGLSWFTIDAAIENAKRIQALRDSRGSFADWLDAGHPRDKADWVKPFKKTVAFTGGEITGELLMSLGHLTGAHRKDCPVYRRIASLDPPWMQYGSTG